MSFRKTVKDALYIAVGAAATAVEAVADAADFLVKKGAGVVARGKEIFSDFCTECFFPDDEAPTVIIEEDDVTESKDETSEEAP